MGSTTGSTTKLAFSGGDFAGKDTMLNLLSDYYHSLSFSDGLKKIANDIFPWCNLDYPPEQKENSVIHINRDTGVNYTPRKVWETLDVLAQIDPEVFIRPVKELLWDIINSSVNKRVIIKDIRRPCELEFCKQQGFTIVFIQTDDERWLNKLENDNRLIIQFRKVIEEYSDFKYMNSKKNENWQNDMKIFVRELLYQMGDHKTSKIIHEGIQ